MSFAVIGNATAFSKHKLRTFLLLAAAGMLLWIAAGSDSQPVYADANLVFLSDCNFGFHSPNYQSNEAVCVSGRVAFDDGEFLIPSGDVFVTENIDWVDQTILELPHPTDPSQPPIYSLDVTRGGANLVVGPGIGGSFFDEFVWLPELFPGEYDIVLDDNRNGIYDAAIDYVVGGGSGFAFRVNLAPLGAFVLDVEEIKGGAAVEKENWEGASKVYDNIGLMKDALNLTKDLIIASGGSGTVAAEFVKNKLKSTAQGKIPVLKDLTKKDYNDAVMDIGKQMIAEVSKVMITHYDDLVNDPADPDYENTVALNVETVDGIVNAALADLGFANEYPYQPLGQRPLEAAYYDLANRLLEQAGIVRALIHSHEKFLGARDANDLFWAVNHANGMVLYSRLLEENLLATNVSAVALKAAMLALPGGQNEWDVEFLRSIKDDLANGGFTEAERLKFINGGWTDADIANLIAAALADDIPDANFTGPGTVDDLIATNTGYLPTVQQFGADALELRDNLEFFVFDVDEPVADAGGPYAAGAGAAFPLDGTASVSNDTSLTYEWDTDLDGQFNDLVGSSPSASFAIAGDRLIGLRVTNDLGLSHFDYALAEITETNLPPVITSFTPVNLDVRVEVGDTPLFSVAATEPEGEGLSFTWFRNGVEVGTGPAYSFTAAVGDLGIQVVRVRVSDTDPFSRDAFEQREVAVLAGDADSDQYHSNYDCNDGDPDVNPGESETIGDGIDNDCDPATPDSGQGPVGAFVAYPVAPVFGVETEFYDFSTDANDDIVSWLWDFGDTSTSTDQHTTHTYATGGDITVSLTVTDAQANVDTFSRVYNIKSPPIPAFSFEPSPAHINEATQFTDLSADTDGTIIDWKWDFDDDGVTDSELQHPEFTFTSTGLFPVRLTVTDNDGVPTSITIDVPVAQPPVADFTISPTSPVVAVDAQFTDASTDDGTIVLYEWDFDNDGGIESNAQNPVHQFFTNGTNNVRLTVTDDEGATGTVLKVVDVEVGEPPEALFSFLPALPVVGDPVQFTDLSTDPDNLIVSWEWDFQNDGVIDSALQNPTHIFSTFGIHDVLLRVTDQAGNQGELVFAGIPSRARPSASFTISDPTPGVGDVVTFTSTSTDPDSPIGSYAWDFGDGSVGSGPAPTHTFTTGGTFDVTLTVTDVHTLTDSATLPVTVTDVGGPTADFSFAPYLPTAGEIVSFTDESTDDGSIVAWDWDFNEDGLTDSTVQNPLHSFGSQGTFTVTLIVTDNDTNTDSISLDVQVGLGDSPVALFALPPVPILGEPAFFIDQSTDSDNAIVSWLWDFGDGGTSTLQNPSHVFNTLGPKDISLTVTDESGNPDTLVLSGLPVIARPVAAFSFGPVGTPPIKAGEDVQFTNLSTDADSSGLGFFWDFNGDGIVDSLDENPIFAFPTAGTFNTKLTVNDSSGLDDEVVHQVVVVAGLPPTPLFSFLPVPIVTGESTQFTDESTDPDDAIVIWEWDFENDGTVDSTLQNPIHVYPVPGARNIRLRVVDEDGNAVALTITGVPVLARPVAAFTISDPTPGVGEVVTFTSTSTDADGTITTFDWDFGDATGDTVSAPTHAFATGGTFDVTLTVTDSDALTSSVTQQVIVTDIGGPTADFSFDPPLPIVGTTVDFTDESTDDGTVVAWEWDFDEDGVADDTTQHPSRLFSTPGTFAVELTVTDDEANVDSVTQNVVVGLGDAPVAAFAHGPTFVDELSVFTDLSTDIDNDIVSWLWDFGDTATSTLQNPTHTYTSLGAKTVSLTVTDAAGNSDSTDQQVIVLDGVLPTADFSFDPPSPEPGQVIQFTDESVDNGLIVSWDWDFEDDGVVDSTEQHPTHLFPVGGSFDIKLTVEDNAGNVDSVIHTLIIPTVPLAAFTTSKPINEAALIDGAEIVGFSSVRTSTPADFAIDTSNSSAWESREGNIAGEFIEIELVGLSLQSVDEIFVEGGTGTLGIQNFELFLSPDGTDGSFVSAITGTAPQSSTGVTVNFTPTDARFARLVVIDNHGGSRVRVEQFKLFNTLDENVAAAADGATIVAVSSLHTTVPAESAIDTNENTFWSPELGTFAGQFFIVKLAAKNVDLHVLNQVNIEGHNGTNAVRGFEVQVSTTGIEPGDFTTAVIGEAAKSTELTAITFPPVHARYVKFIVLSNWGHATEVRVDRFEAWTQQREGGIVSLTEGPLAKIVDFSSVRSTAFPENAIDDQSNSIWRADSPTDEYLTIELAGRHVYTINELRFRSTSATEGPKNFDLLVSTTDAEDASFSVAFSGVGDGSTNNQVFTFPPVQARYVKFFIHDVIGATACCVRLSNLAIFSVAGGSPSKLSGLGAAVVEVSSASNTTSRHPRASLDLSASDGWTTNNGDITDQYFKFAVTPGTPGAPYLVNKFRIEGSTGTNAVKDFEIWASDTGFDEGSGLSDPNFRKILSGTIEQTSGRRWYEIEPTRATHLMFVARNNHGSGTNIFLDRFRVYAVDLGGSKVPFEDRSVDPGGSIVSWQWNFGDGTTSTEQHPVHSYGETGTFPVTLTVTDNDGNSDSTSFDYTVLQGPVAAFTEETLTPFEGQRIQLTDISTDEGAPTISRAWEFSYQPGVEFTSKDIFPTFPDNGEFTVRLRVLDQQLLSDTLIKTFSVQNQVPQNVRANLDNAFSSTNPEGQVTAVWGEPLRVGASWSDVSPDNSGNAICDVDFGDGQTLQVNDCSAFGLGQNFHSYDLPGDYTATVTITDKDGGWASDTQPVTINRRESHTTIWGDDALRPPDGGGPLTAFARLIDFDPLTRGTPLEGQTLTFSLGGVTQDVVTDVNGEAQATFNYALGQTDYINVSFAGTTFYEGSIDRPFITGDVVVAVGDGMAHRFAPTGEFINVFDSTSGSRETAGMCFDSDGNLYLTSFQLGMLTKFDRTTGVTTPQWATSSFSRFVESCVLGQENLDADPELEDVIFTGEVDGVSDIRKWDRDGNLLQTYDVVIRDRGADWIDLTIDPVSGDFILFYTTEGDDILRYDLTNDVQLPDFVTDQTVEANQLIPSPDRLPENAIDDDPNSIWQTHVTEVTNQHITVDLVGDIHSIDRVFTEGQTSNTAIRNFQVLVSTTGTEDADFTTVFTGVSPRNSTGLEQSFPAVDARYVRLLALDNYGDANRLRVDQFKVLNTSGDNVASLTDGATITDFSSVERDPLLTRPCFAMRVLPDGSVMTACRGGVAHVSADGTELVRFYDRSNLSPEATTLFALNLDPDGTSFWTSGFNQGQVVKVDIATGDVLLGIWPMRRGPTVAGLIVFDEPLAGINQIPVADGQSVSTDEDTPLLITLTGSDLDDDELTFEIVTPPNNGDLTGTAPDLTYTPDPDYVGPDSITFRVNDGVQNSDVAVISIDVLLVNSPPVADTGGPYVSVVGEILGLDGSDSSDPDADDTIVSFEWDLDNDGVFDDSTEITPSITFPSVGLFTVALRVTDNHGTSGIESTSVFVSGDPPDVDAGLDQLVGPADLISLDPATFTDTGLSDTHSATIDWGDGTLEPGILTQGAGFGSVDGSHTYAGAGPFTVLVCVTDSDGLTGCDSLVVTIESIPPVADPAGPYEVDEGSTVALDGTGSTDPDGIVVLYEWDLDEDGVFAETGVDATNGDETGDSPTFDATLLDGPATISISLRVTDNDGLTDTTTTDVTVNNVDPTALLGNDGPVNEGSQASVSFSAEADASPGDVTAGFLYSYDFGDDGSFEVIDSPVPTELVPLSLTSDGPALVPVLGRITDKDGGFTEIQTEIVVQNLGPTAQFDNDGPVIEGSQASVTFSGEADASPEDTTAGFLYSYDFGDDGSFEVIDSLVPTELVPLSLTSDGPALVPVLGRITDKDGGFTEIQAEIVVLNLGPTVSFDPVSGQTESPVEISIDFTDPGVFDLHTATVDWGDGTGIQSLGPVTSPFSASHTYTTEDTFTVTVVVTDSDGADGTGTNIASISIHPNTPPVAVPGEPYEVDEGSTVQVDGTGSFDPDDAGGNQPLGGGGSRVLASLGGGLALSPITLSHGGEVVLYEWDLDGDGVFGETGPDAVNGDETGAVTTFDASLLDGPQTVVIALRVTDSAGSTGTATTTVEVLNVAPTVAATDDAINEGEVATIEVTFTDPGVPDTHDATIDWGDGSLDTIVDPANSPFNSQHIYTDNGLFTVTITVTDDDGGIGATTAEITVANLAPTAVLGNDGPIDEGSQATVSFSGQSDASVDDAAAGFLYSFDFQNDGVFDVSNSPLATQLVPLSLTADGPAIFTVLGRITDKDGGFTEFQTEIVVLNVVPVAEMIGDVISEGEEAEIIALLFDPGVFDNSTLSVDWGDGTVDVIPVAAGVTEVRPTHVYPDDNPTATSSDLYVIGITLEDRDGGITETATSVTVNNLSPTVSATGDTVLLGEVASVGVSFTDPGVADTHSATINWGDGSSDTVVDPATSPFTAPHSYATAGIFPVTVTITDDDGGIGGTTTTVDVLAPPTADAGGPYEVGEGSSVGLSGAGSSDTGGTIVLYEWDLDEDGVFGETGIDAANGDETGVSPTFSAAQLDGPDLISISLRVTDDSGLTDTAASSVTINNVAPTGALGNDGPVGEGTLATVSFSGQFDPSPGDTASGFLYSYDFGNDGSFEVIDSPVPTEIIPLSLTSDGPVAIPVLGRITDKDGGFSEVETEIVVLNVAPAVSATGDTIDEGGEATVAVLFTDPGIPDTHTATVSWGDGSPDTVVDPASSPVSPTHVYPNDGIFNVTVTVTDDDGGVGEAGTSVTVRNVGPSDCVLDPEGDLSGSIGRNGQGYVHNVSETCSYDVGIASYQVFDDNIDYQVLFDSNTAVIGPGERIDLAVQLPDCRSQADLFYGAVLQSLDGYRYGERLLDYYTGGAYCETGQGDIGFSLNNTRTPAEPLVNGTELAGDVYIFLLPDIGADRVSFYLDDPVMSGPPHKVEQTAPFDFNSGSVDAALPFDALSLAPGEHTVTAHVEPYAGAAYTLTRTFIVPGEIVEPLALGSEWPQAAVEPTHELSVSVNADRTASTLLEGSELSGEVYIFLGTNIDPSQVNQVRFYLDDPAQSGSPHRTESSAPYDLNSGSVAAAEPLDARSLSPGAHTVTAVVEVVGGDPVTVHATFTVTGP